MREESENYMGEEETAELVRRFEEMLGRNSVTFLDAFDFERIVDFYLQAESYSKAKQAVDIAGRIYPGSSVIQLKKAEYHYAKGELNNALELLSALEPVDSHNPDLYLLKGQALFELGDVQRSVACFDRAVEVGADDTVELLYRVFNFYLGADEVNLALKYLQRCYGVDSTNLSVLFDLGFCYEQRNELGMSLRYYNEYLDIDPFSASVWYNMGIVYTKQGLLDEALEAYDYCLAVDPGYSSAYHNKANTLASLERYDEAIKVFTDLLELEPGNPGVFVLLGECYEKSDKLDLALKAYRRAIELDSSYADGYFGIGMVMAARQKFDVSLSFVKRAIALDPEQYDFWLGLGRVHYDMNNIPEAINAYREATTLNPDEPDAYLALAEVLLYQEKFQEVETLVDELGDRFSTNASIKVINAAALYLSHRQKEALDMLRDAKRIDPQSIDDFFSLIPIVNDDDFMNSVKLL